MLLLYLSFSIKLETITLLLKYVLCTSEKEEEEERKRGAFKIWTVIPTLVSSGPSTLKQRSLLSVSHAANTTIWLSVIFVQGKPKIYDCL